MVAAVAAAGWWSAASTPAKPAHPCTNKALATAGKSHQYSEETRETPQTISASPPRGRATSASNRRCAAVAPGWCQEPPLRRGSACLVPALTSGSLLPIAATARRDRRGQPYRQHRPARRELWTATAVSERGLRGAEAVAVRNHLPPRQIEKREWVSSESLPSNCSTRRQTENTGHIFGPHSNSA